MILNGPLMIHGNQKIALWPIPQEKGEWMLGKVWKNETGYEPWENWRFANENDATTMTTALNTRLGLT